MFYGLHCELIVFLWHEYALFSPHREASIARVIKAYTCGNASDGVTNIVTPSLIHLSPYPHIGSIFHRHNG